MSGITFTLPAMRSGIYHLLRAGRVVYVGQSINVWNRLGGWATLNARESLFDSVAFFPCEAEQLNELEEEHIRRYDPPMNKAGRTWPYIGASKLRMTATIRKHGGVREYLASRDALICGGDIRTIGIPLNNPALLSLPSFPKPVKVQRTKQDTRAYWRRDDVLAWLSAEHPELLAA